MDSGFTHRHLIVLSTRTTRVAAVPNGWVTGHSLFVLSFKLDYLLCFAVLNEECVT